jgi:hypothetical protein
MITLPLAHVDAALGGPGISSVPCNRPPGGKEARPTGRPKSPAPPGAEGARATGRAPSCEVSTDRPGQRRLW